MTASDLWLSPVEVEQLTARKRWSAQCRALAAMSIPFRPNAVGRPLVERTAVMRPQRSAKRSAIEPNWSAIGGKAA